MLAKAGWRSIKYRRKKKCDFHIAITDSIASSDIVKSGLRWVSPLYFVIIAEQKNRTKTSSMLMSLCFHRLLPSKSRLLSFPVLFWRSRLPRVIYIFTSLVSPLMCFTCVSVISPELPCVTLWWSLYFCVEQSNNYFLCDPHSLFFPVSLLDILSLTDSAPGHWNRVNDY